MKLDVRLIKYILNDIQEKESHYVSTKNIFEDVQTKYSEIDNETFKLVGWGFTPTLNINY